MVLVLHVDEVYEDKPVHIAKLQLAGNFAGSLQIGSHGSLLDPVLAGRPSRVDVNRHQRFGRIDDQVAARFQLHHWMIHGGKLILHAMTLRSEEHTSELQSLMRISYAVFCLKKKKIHTRNR